ncbi:MAG TPA: hypothetical protein VH678_08705 [Xanthobacteraceae bacterium]
MAAADLKPTLDRSFADDLPGSDPRSREGAASNAIKAGEFADMGATCRAAMRLRVELSPEARRRFRLAGEEANDAPLANLVGKS